MSEANGKKKLAVIDGKSVFYRGYFAMPNLSKKDGTPTGGVYGFAVMALEVIRRIKPDYVAVAWDKPKTNIRRRLEMYPAYKAGRKPAPPDFNAQVPLLHELLEAFGWPLYELDEILPDLPEQNQADDENDHQRRDDAPLPPDRNAHAGEIPCRPACEEDAHEFGEGISTIR